MSDYISREAAVKIAQKYGLANGSVLGRHSGLADCIAIEIEGLPSADVEPVRRWIPCSERTPEVDDNYLCVYHFEAGNRNYVSTLFFYATDPSTHFQCEGLRGLKVTHWMPIPVPPEEEP